MRLPAFVRALIAIAFLLSGASFANEPRVERLRSDYQHFWLTLDTKPEATRIFIGLREQTSATVWIVGGAVPSGIKLDGTPVVLIDEHAIKITDASLTGRIALRQASIWPAKLLGEVELTVDLKRTASQWSGQWTMKSKAGSVASGTATGTLLTQTQVRAAGAFAESADWPSYHGPAGTNRSGSQPKLIPDLSKARPIWRADETVLSGWGTGADQRYSWRAAVGTVCGGSGTPILSNGKIYLTHFRPTGEPTAEARAKVLAEFVKGQQREPLERELAGIIDFSRPFADTVVTCLDAATGSVNWRVTCPHFAENYQTHKWRGLNPTATVVDGVLIASDLAGNWIGLDADRGDVLWTLRTKRRSPLATADISVGKVEKDSAVIGAIPAGAIAVLPTQSNEPVRAIEPRSGKVVWTAPTGQQALVWGEAGRERILLFGRSAPTAHDAASGKLLWTLPENLIGDSGSAALISGDLLVGHVFPDPKQKRGGHFQGWKLNDSAPQKLWQDEYLPFDENLTVSLSADRAFVVGQKEVRCLDLKSGKQLAKQTFENNQHAPGSNQWLAVVGDRLLLSPEGQHGRMSLQWLSASDLSLLGSRWEPLHNSTTAYGKHSLAVPIVDGRLIVRGMDGIYCYDVRE